MRLATHPPHEIDLLRAHVLGYPVATPNNEEAVHMGIGTSIFLFAIGAILRFAVTVQTEGFNLHTIGVILMIVGAIGALFSLMFWSTWGGFGRTAYSDDPDVVVERPRRTRTVYVEKENRV